MPRRSAHGQGGESRPQVDDSTTGLHGVDVSSHGVDVSSRGADKLDRDCLHFALEVETPAPAAIDIGCGRGAQSLRLAALGWRVWMVDLLDLRATVDSWNAIHQDRLTFLRKDARTLSRDDLPGAAHLLYSQRFLHHLTYADAGDVLTLLTGVLVSGGRAFLSASGLDGQLGAGYPHADRPARARFAPLAAEIAARHEILEPVCLYREDDLQALASRAGLRTIAVTRTSFGNIKGTFVKP